MNKKLASILITNFNKDKYLKKTIYSCLKQNYNKKEVLIIDDCSTDNSKKLLNMIKSKDLKIYFNKKRKFLSGPLNQLYNTIRLFNYSKGNYIFLLDSDDHYKEGKINWIVKIFKKTKLLILFKINLISLRKEK